MAELSWFPYDCGEWERRVRELGLSAFEEGALMRLLRHAWAAPVPCTVLDTPDELARIVGAEWKKALKVFREQFAALPDEPGRRRCGWLYDLHLRQMEKHLSYQTRGKKGGRPRRTESSASPRGEQLEAELSDTKAQVPTLSRAESTTEVLSCAPTEHTAKNPPAGHAPAPEGAARAAAEDLAEFGDAWRSVVTRESRSVAQSETQSRAANQRERRYFALLASEAAAWMALHREDAVAIEREQRALLDLPETGDLLLQDRRALRDAVLEAIRERLGWPTTEEWDESDALTAVPATGATP